MFRKLKYNGSGCLDLTAYQAIINIEMENRRKRKLKQKDKYRK